MLQGSLHILMGQLSTMGHWSKNYHHLALKVVLKLKQTSCLCYCLCKFSATTLPSHVQQYLPGGVMPQKQEAVGMGRGYGRGRGRSLLTPVRQPNTRPPPPKVSMGRGIGSLTSGAQSDVVIDQSFLSV